MNPENLEEDLKVGLENSLYDRTLCTSVLEKTDVSIYGESTGLADVRLLVEGRSVPVIKTVLSVASPVFRAMFQDDFKEKYADEISLPGKKLDDVLTLLKCIYPDILLTITGSEAFTVLPFSEEYQMASLKVKCEDAMLETLDQRFDDFYMKDSVCLYKYLTISFKYDLERLETYCVSLAADFKQRDRERAMQIHDIPVDVVRRVDMLAISRLETIRGDANSCIHSSCKLKDVIKSLCSRNVTDAWYFSYRGTTERATDVKRVTEDHFRAARLAYTFLTADKDTLKFAVSTIRDDKQRQRCWQDEEYNLLPENIKRDFENAK